MTRKMTLPLVLSAMGWFACFAQSGIAADVKELISQAYQLTNTAKGVEDYSSIIQLCTEAEQAELTKEQADYIKSLLAWAHNRRGEVFAEQATQAHESGKTQQAQQLDGKALADYEASLQFDPARWKTWHNRAVSRAIAGKYEEAIADFTKVIELKPDYAHAWFNRGEILYDLGKIQDAIADYSEAIKLDGKDVGAITSRAHSYFRLGDTERAMQDYGKAIELAPNNTEVFVNRGDALQILGKWFEAAEDFRAAIALNEQDPRTLQSTAWLMATSPEPDILQANYAVQLSERAIKILESSGQKPDWRYLDTVAAAYANANRFDDAVKKITAAIQLASTEQKAILQKRLELYQRKQPYRQAVGEKTAQTAGASKKKSPR